MPSGLTHDRIAVAASPLLAGAGVAVGHWMGRPPAEALLGGLIFAASHLACSHWLSPDLDLGSSSIDERWGVLRPIWAPYERLIPHRHWLSHSGFSALLRLIYLFLALNAVLLLLGLIILLEGAVIGRLLASEVGSRALWAWLWDQYIAVSTAGVALVRDHPAETVAVAAGSIAADVLHTVADRADTARKRRYRRRARAARRSRRPT